MQAYQDFQRTIYFLNETLMMLNIKYPIGRVHLSGCISRAVKLSFISVGKQILYFIDGVVGYSLKNLFEPSVRFDAVHFAGAE